MNLIKPKASHWYQLTPEGILPCYELPKKTSAGMKKPTLREAKQMRLFPSVTNVLDILSKPALTNWLISNGIMAALTLPRLPDEPLDKFAVRVVEDMDSQSQESRDFGTEVHDHIEHYVSHGEVLLNDAEPYTKSAREWVQTNVTTIYGTETTVHHPIHCIAGRLDLDAEVRSMGRSIVDFKSQGVKKKDNGEWNPRFYDEWFLQLSAYAACVSAGDAERVSWPSLISVIINSEEPGQAFTKVWNNPEKGFRLFLNSFELWKWRNSYDPAIPI